MSDDKHLDRIAALLRQAETTKNADEADAFTQKAQKLASAYAISLEIARNHQANKEKRETPVQRTIRLGTQSKKGLKYYCRLFMAVGGVNDVQFNIAHNSTYVIAFGFPSDIEVTELLYASLIVQMIESSNRYLATGEYRNEIDWNTYRPIDGRVARSNFMETYIARISARLREARREAVSEAVESEALPEADAPSTGTELVLANKSLEVRSFYKQKSTARGSWGGYSSSKGYSAGARQAGISAANSARLSAQRAIGNSARQIGS